MSHASPQDTNPRPRACPTAGAADVPLTPSKSQRKRDAYALQTLGIQLVALSAAQLARLDLPETLHEAVLAAQRMRSHGARTRQLQYIGKVMRQLEPGVLSRVRAAMTARQADGQGLEPDHGGGHVASSTSQRNR
jgi:ribosome-associated protein